MLRLLACLLLIATGCDDTMELQDLARDRKRLEARRDQLEKQIHELTAGKTTFTDPEKAVLTPLSTELQNVKNELGGVRERESKLKSS